MLSVSKGLENGLLSNLYNTEAKEMLGKWAVVLMNAVHDVIYILCAR